MPEAVARKYKPRFYAVVVTIPADPGPTLPPGKADGGSFTVVNVPFVATRMTSAIVGDNQLAAFVPVTAIIQDGQYAIEFRTDQHNFQSEPIMAAAFHGNPGGFIDFPCPVELAPKVAVSIRVMNLITRQDALRVQVVFHGIEPLLGPIAT